MTILYTHPLLMGPVGFQELLIILLIILVVFGASKIPLLGQGIGEGIKNFKKGIKDDEATAIEEPGPSDDG